jgi:ubiquinone/menaquinone biosynthesis C-methylase UbiE
MDIDQLKAQIRSLQKRDLAAYVSTLEERKLEERNWGNFSRDRQNPHAPPGETNESSRANMKWYSTTQTSIRYREEWMKANVPGKVFVDYACGNGEMTIKAAKMGAALAIGIDLSDVSVSNAEAAAAVEGVAERTAFFTGDCEATGLPDHSVDAILCSYMLHHVDVSRAFPEIHRILKPGGVVFVSEALAYNPVIQLYRKLTPELRTEWEKEHILSLREVRMAKKWFNVGDLRYWHLFSVLGAFVRRVPPLFNLVMPALHGLDALVTRIPGLQLMAWQFSFQLVKPRV